MCENKYPNVINSFKLSSRYCRNIIKNAGSLDPDLVNDVIVVPLHLPFCDAGKIPLKRYRVSVAYLKLRSSKRLYKVSNINLFTYK